MTDFSVFSDKVAVITGAGSGIGRALAVALAAQGSALALADCDSVGLEATRKGLAAGGRVTTYTLDVSDRAAYIAFVEQVVKDHGQVDIVINNAGVARVHSMSQGSYDDYQKSFDINIWGVLYGCKEFLPYLQQRPRSWLVNISSLAGIVGVANYTSYNASKFAVRGLSESLRNELRGTSVQVSCVHPGGVNTNIARDAMCSADAADSVKKLSKVILQMSPERAAKDILQGMARGKKRILVGRDAKILDMIARLFPVAYDDIVAWYG